LAVSLAGIPCGKFLGIRESWQIMEKSSKFVNGNWIGRQKSRSSNRFVSRHFPVFTFSVS